MVESIFVGKKNKKKDEDSTDEIFKHEEKKEAGEELLGNSREIQKFYGEVEPIKIREIDDIVKEAKQSFILTKDRMKIQRASKKFGELRPICGPLIQEIKDIEAKRRADALQKKNRKGLTESIQEKATWSPAPDFPIGYTPPAYGHGMKDSLQQNSKTSDESSDPNRLFRVIRRHDLLPTKNITPFAMMHQAAEEQSALRLAAANTNNAEENDENNIDGGSIGSNVIVEERTLVRPSSAQAQPIRRMYSTDSTAFGMRPASAGLSRMNSVSRMNSQDFYDLEGTEEDYDFQDALCVFDAAGRTKSGSITSTGVLRRSSSFMPSIIEQDDRISKALKIKEELQQAKEEKLRKRIQDREESAQLRLMQKQIQDRQRSWISIVLLMQRMKVLVDALAKDRHEKAWQGHSTQAKRAIALIKK